MKRRDKKGEGGGKERERLTQIFKNDSKHARKTYSRIKIGDRDERLMY